MAATPCTKTSPNRSMVARAKSLLPAEEPATVTTMWASDSSPARTASARASGSSETGGTRSQTKPHSSARAHSSIELLSTTCPGPGAGRDVKSMTSSPVGITRMRMRS